MRPMTANEPGLRPLLTTPFSHAEISSLKHALDRLLEYENREWPTPERHAYIQGLEQLRNTVAIRMQTQQP
jgi:hypothetical protein